MPLSFPSHQGLLAPLWRLWPERFSVLALWAGALAPDAVDGAADIVLRGRLGQWMGHSVLGLFTLSVPVGLGLTWGTRRGARRWARGSGGGGLRRRLRRLAAWVGAVDRAARLAPRARWRFEAVSVWVGALSHIAFDLLSHEGSRLLWPWSEDPAWFGPWWQGTWFRVSPPGYAGYSIGPHFVAWAGLSVAGAVMFFAWPPRVRE